MPAPAPTTPLTPAQAAIVASCVPLARHVARRVAVARGLDFDDALSQAFVVLIDAARGYDPDRLVPETGRPAKPSSYVAECLKKGLLPARGRWFRKESVGGDDPDGPAVNPAVADPAAVEHREEVARLLLTLTPTEAEVLMLRFGIGVPAPRSPAAVAAIVGLTPAAVRGHEVAAVRKLRAMAGFADAFTLGAA